MIKKKLVLVVTFFMMLSTFILPLSVTATSLLSEKGSITLKLTDINTGKPLENVAYKLYLIANAYNSGDVISYEMLATYSEAGVDLGDLQDSSLPIHLAYFASSHSQPNIEKSTNEKGTLIFDNLKIGLYLIVPVQNEDYNCVTTPFLISIPLYDTQTGELKYDVDASPKINGVDSGTENNNYYISVKKKWNTYKSNVKSVTVVLLRDFQEYEKVHLNAKNNWYYRWDNLSKNHIWNVVEADVPKGYTAYYSTSSNTVTITNRYNNTEETTTKPTQPTQPDDDDKLVQTGQLNWPVPVCIISGLVIFSIGWILLNSNKKEIE